MVRKGCSGMLHDVITQMVYRLWIFERVVLSSSSLCARPFVTPILFSFKLRTLKILGLSYPQVRWGALHRCFWKLSTLMPVLFSIVPCYEGGIENSTLVEHHSAIDYCIYTVHLGKIMKKLWTSVEYKFWGKSNKIKTELLEKRLFLLEFQKDRGGPLRFSA